jgi:excinuclease ABC subunit C
MAIHELKAQVARLPEQPGVYLYLNRANDTIYVGKARSLRDRVRTYLGAYGTSPRHDALLDEIHRIEFIVTDSVVEALALENHLIKQRSPRYNILLRDDKNYPYLKLTTGEAFPRILVARRVERDGHFYAGPFLPATFARKTMALTHRLFGLRSCNEIITGKRGRPCLEYDIKRCIAPCVDSICTPAQYTRAVVDSKLLLEGRREELAAELKDRMLAAAADERYEQAAQLRDAMRTVMTLHERQQKMATARLGDRDAFGVKVGPAGALIMVFVMRGGRVIERIELITEPGTGRDAHEAPVLEAALQQFYEVNPVPPEIHLPVEPEDSETLEAWLSGRAGRTVHLVVPRRGDKRGLIELATRNAALAYETRFNEDTVANYDALETLRAVLGLSAVPRRIECFDVSTIQGSETVASMVVCEDGRMRRAEYRKYRIQGLARARARGRISKTPRPAPAPDRVPDDFAAMHEVVLRRYRLLLERGGPFPDLVLIDGGKGQLTAAYEALEELGLANLVAVGLAKKEELVFTRDRPDAIRIDPRDPSLRLIQRIRDEAHRFAVTYHRRARTLRDLASELDDVPGIGPRRRRALLVRFGSLAGVRRATREELVPLVGTRAADSLLSHFAAMR